jgi:hypothetical protein
MARRHKRSISLPPDLDQAIEVAAELAGMTVSAWLAETVAHRLRLEAGRDALAQWEAEQGALSPEELARGRARARASLGRD